MGIIYGEWYKRGEHIRHFETTRQKKDGTMVDVSLTVSPIFNSSGEVIGASTIARDVTERKQAEDAIHKAAINSNSWSGRGRRNSRNPTTG